MAGTGPRDWLPDEPPRYGLRGAQSRPHRRLRRGFGTGLALSLVVVPPAILIWMLFWQVGLVSTVVSWLTGLAAVWLFKRGSGGLVSRRGAIALLVVVAATTLLCVVAALVWDVLNGGLPPELQLARFDRWLPGLITGLLFGALGLVPMLFDVAGRHLGVGTQVMLVVLSFAAIAGIHYGTPLLTRLADDSAAVDRTGSEGIFLAVGECLATGPSAFEDPQGAESVHVSCDLPHVTEAFYEVPLGGDPAEPYPGDEQVYYRAMEFCSAPFLEFIGVPHSQSTIGLQVHRPLEEGWAAGDRTARCLAISLDGEVTGTLRDANR